MRAVVMKEQRCDSYGWHETGAKMFRRASRWIKVRTNYKPTKRNSLWDYVLDENGKHPNDKKFDPNSLFLDYFRWNGRNYAIEQFLCYGNPFWNPVTYSYEEDGKRYFLAGCDRENYYHPISIEMDDYGENVRVYEEA